MSIKKKSIPKRPKRARKTAKTPKKANSSLLYKKMYELIKKWEERSEVLSDVQAYEGARTYDKCADELSNMLNPIPYIVTHSKVKKH